MAWLRAAHTGLIGAVLLAGAAAVALADSGADKPGFIRGEVLCTAYDGVGDDLLTGGLGKTGLLGAAPPLSAPPSAAELRRLAIYNNYRALVPVDPGGGYGTLFGPNIDAAGNDTGGEGLVAGTECLAFAGDEAGRRNVTVMVQVPAAFDPDEACIVTAPSSGSRGVYGAVGTAGEWGLRNGCAVAYSDKGTGNGAHDLQANTVNLITGERADADLAGRDSIFTAPLDEMERLAFNAATPNRFAFKHAHSRLNPERDWGRDVLRSVVFAFFVLNELHGTPAARDDDDDDDDRGRPRVRPGNTIVIASSVSNGGGASVRAAERDRRGLIDGVAVSEPNVNPRPGGDFAIRQGAGPEFRGHSKSLYAYTTVLHLHQGCANLANPTAPFNTALLDVTAVNRCSALHDKGLLQAATPADQAAEAQAIINAFGLLPEQNAVQPSHWALSVPQAVAVTYGNAYGRASVTENLCGYNFGATGLDERPAALPPASAAAIFATGNGIPPTGGVNVINNESLGGPARDQVSLSRSSGLADQNLDGALCLRGLATGVDPVTGAGLGRGLAGFAGRIERSIAKIRANGDLDGLPAVFVTGRSDAILAPNHTSRAYLGLNSLVEGGASGLRYYEVKNAQHLDALTILDVIFGAPLFSDKFVPLHHYLFQALDLMFDHLKNGAPLPPSQVVRAVPRGIAPGATPPFSLADVPPLDEAANLPAIAQAPPPGDLIRFENKILEIPD